LFAEVVNSSLRSADVLTREDEPNPETKDDRTEE